MIVVSNTSPVANLAAIGRLALLRDLFGRILIPEAVYAEICAADAALASTVNDSTQDWIEVRAVANHLLVASLCLELDYGEAAAIALASESPQSILLIDERKGRAVATRLGLAFIGLLGILIEAKRRGLLPAIRPILDALMSEAGFWIHQDLRERVLLAAGE